ncbi:MAG: conjugal transfer protein TraI [Chitinophagaceae bacterium]
MNKITILYALASSMSFIPVQSVNAQFPIADIIKAAVVKVIKATDLAVQRLQNRTIWLQNAQKSLENTLSKARLEEITGWVEKQRLLYKDYFEELTKVKTTLAYYHRIRAIGDKQVRMVQEYKRAWYLLRQDEHFTAQEIVYMGKVYTGILDESLDNLDQVLMVVSSFTTSMTDASRLQIINHASDKIDDNYYDMKRFNKQNTMLSLQRAKDQADVEVIRKLYGIE